MRKHDYLGFWLLGFIVTTLLAVAAALGGMAWVLNILLKGRC